MAPEAVENRSPFWAFQLGGWSLFFLILLGMNFFRSDVDWTVVVMALSVYGFGMFSTALFRYYVKKRDWLKRGPFRLILPVMVGSAITSLVLGMSYTGVRWIVSLYAPQVSMDLQTKTILVTALNNYFIVLLWSLIYFAFHYFRIAQISRVERYRSEAAMRDAQLNTLKGQINPHFMFNSLNNIRALMLEDVPRSREMLTKLSDLLRYSMTISEQRDVALKYEIEVVQDFLDLCKVQYESRLSYEIKVDDALMHHKIPPMVIQMLVENSVKHGVSASREGGKVMVTGREENNRLILEISNSGQWNNNPRKQDSHGIGLPNIRRRLQLMYGEEASLHLSEEDEFVVARIQLPL